MKFISNNTISTINIGKKIAKKKFAGNKVIFLRGDLGAGKTTITKGFAKGLGFKSIITSPTFTIMNDYYNNKYAMFHIDMYRVESADELIEIGLDSYILGEADDRSNNIVIVEWPERISGLRNHADIEIVIKKINENKREIIVDEK